MTVIDNPTGLLLWLIGAALLAVGMYGALGDPAVQATSIVRRVHRVVVTWQEPDA